MAKTITYPKLPRPPRRATPGKGQLTAIEDPIVRRLLSDLQDRISKVDQRFQNLDTFALKAGSPIPAYGQRIVNVGAPVHPNDAVPLWKLQQFVDTQAALIGRASGGGSGDGTNLSNEFGIIGAGSLPPTVALPNLYAIVYDYALANPTQLTNSCQSAGGTWDFMDGVIAALQAVDANVGYNWKRGVVGDASQDAIAYWHQPGSPVQDSASVYVVDVIGGHCGASPHAAWINVTKSSAQGGWSAFR